VAQQAAIRPYVLLCYTQTWTAKDPCYGPTREVLTLAPGETLTRSFRTFRQHDVTQIVQDTVTDSHMVARTEYEASREPTVHFPDIFVSAFGSFWETVGTVGGAIVGGALGGPVGAGLGAFLGDAVGGLLEGGGGGGGGGSGADTVADRIDSVIDVVDMRQSSHLTETVDTRTTITERLQERTIPNPYRDRSLQLRIIPVFRQYEVQTILTGFKWGVSLDTGMMVFPKAGNGLRIGDVIQRRALDPRVAALANRELGMDDELVPETLGAGGGLAEHLNANASFYTKAYLRQLQDRGDSESLTRPVKQGLDEVAANEKDADSVARALAWSAAHVEGRSVYVPATDSANAVAALNIPARRRPAVEEAVQRIVPANLPAVRRTRVVRLPMGDHIEPSAGECVLKDVPPLAAAGGG
jgi:hypothetical protein